ncbi:MAG TPA: valine--tRNA ligase [Candidatus Paceibacterota bacterium]
MAIPDKFLKPYAPEVAEPVTEREWEESGFANPDKCIEAGITAADAEKFSIMLPPPNVTGMLHTGHAIMLAIQDIMVRHARMQGKKTLWLPGTDHAAIATQSVVEKQLSREGVRRTELGREKFLEKVEAYAAASRETIVSQMKAMGASVDWSREAYTLDATRNLAVRTAFKKMFDDGLIYRGDRIVNWDPKGQTTISDDEIVYAEEKTKFYYFRYGPFTIGTSRPETKFGDKHVVMHPDDARYAEFKHGQKIDLEWINGPITATVIKDEAIDPAFGSGVMTITPWHSTVDFEIAERHKLEREQIIDRYGKLLPIAGEFAEMKIAEAREKIVAKLEAKGLLVKIEDYTHNVATAERTGGMIEPQIMRQWFVDVNKEFKMEAPLHGASIPGIKPGSKTTFKKVMLAAVESGQIKILPGDRFERIYFNWIENLRDWCISRQIWYGHRIPVWYRGEETYCGIEAPSKNWESEGWAQDEDTLDTWFSSGLWTFSTLGWPNLEAADLETYHPTDILETGADILFFWVARMILMSGYFLGEIPFHTVYIHGLVRDAKGRKISKSLGNGLDPLVMSQTHGADALRLALIVGNGPGADINFSEDKIRAYRKFCNKLWNIARFVYESCEDLPIGEHEVLENSRDAGYLSELDGLVVDIDAEMGRFHYHLASEKLYHFAWHRFADEILEELKPTIQNKESHERASAQATLLRFLDTLLKLLHPFAPFVTEEIWRHHPARKSLLMVERWPRKAKE